MGKKAKFITLVIDLDSGRVFWVGKGRGKDALQGFWRRVRKAKTQIEAVSCDMSAAYWSAVREHLPAAVLVFDRFDFATLRPAGSLRLSVSLRSAHVIKLVNGKIDAVRRQVQKQAEHAGYKQI